MVRREGRTSRRGVIMKINWLMQDIHTDNIDRGWWNGVLVGTSDVLDPSKAEHRSAVFEKHLLVHNELSEAVEEIRNGNTFRTVGYVRSEAPVYGGGKAPEKPVGFPTEIADAVIRLLDLAAACGINLETVIAEKLAYNRTRGYRHGGKTA